MNDDFMGYAIQRLREATTNREAVVGNLIEDSRAEATETAQIARFEGANQDSKLTRRDIEDVAIGVLGKVFDRRCDYGDVVEAIKQAHAGWLYPIILERALNPPTTGEGEQQPDTEA